MFWPSASEDGEGACMASGTFLASVSRPLSRPRLRLVSPAKACVVINKPGTNFSVWLCVTVLAAANGRKTEKPVLSLDGCHDQQLCCCFAVSWLCYDAATKWEDGCEYLPIIHLPMKPQLSSKDRLRCMIILFRDRCGAHEKKIISSESWQQKVIPFDSHVSDSDTLKETVMTPSQMINHLTVPPPQESYGISSDGQPVGYCPVGQTPSGQLLLG